MKLRPAHVQYEVLAVYGSLGLTLESLLDEAARKGEERDDRPRQYALAVRRWSEGRLEARALGVAARALAKKGTQNAGAGDEEARGWASICHAVNALASWRADCMENPSHTPRAVARLLELQAQVLVALGEAPDAARARVAGTYARAFEARTGKKPPTEPPEPRRSRLSS